MKFTLSWLKSYLDTTATLETICEKLTIIGLEVEEVIDRTSELGNFKVASIISAEPHPNADKLRVCKVDNGKDILQIVCGASNARAGIKVVLAEVGTLIPNGNFKIKSSEVRGVKSEGMLCSEEELLVGSGTEGIIELPLDATPGENFLKYYGLDDPVIEVSVTPNRGDCLGVYNIARDLAASGLGALKELKYNKINSNFSSTFKATVKDAHLSPLFVLREFKNVKNCESPIWLKNLLKNIGLNPISALVDITNYISYSFARPLHCYDKAKLNEGLEVRSANSYEKIQALNGKEYNLDLGDIVIADNKNIHALGGIIGSEGSGCLLNTTNIILESALFDKVSIAKTGRRLQLSTDARHRFERHVDPNFTLTGAEIASQMIIDICGGEASDYIIHGDKEFKKNNINFDFARVKQRTGLEISHEEMITILKNLGFKILSIDAESAKLEIPSWRSDITIQEDIVEEISRIYGYDRLPLTPLPSFDFVKARLLTQKQRRIKDARRVLSANGLDEAYTWSFMSSEKAKYFVPLNDELFIANPIASNLDYMRPCIIPNLFELIAKNKARSFNNLGFFEIGPIFKGRAINDEKQVISAVRIGNYIEKTIFGAAREVDIYDIKADLESTLEEFNFSINKLQLSNDKPNYYHPNRAATLKLGNKIIAHFGELHPQITQEFDIKNRVVAFELFIEELPEVRAKFGKKEEYIISDYQAVERDFAFLITDKTNVGDMVSFIKTIEKEIIREVNIFDIYKGQNIEDGKKSVALSVLLQAGNRTLTDEELQNICAKLIKEVEKKFNASLRDIK
jgi:phenylalanyl-tRNA synthetase beta chain